MKPVVVYRYFSATDELLYIGCTENLEQRAKGHQRTSRWFTSVARVEVEGPYDFETGRQIEKAAIQSEKPIHNFHYTGKPLVRSPEWRTFRKRARLLREVGAKS